VAEGHVVDHPYGHFLGSVLSGGWAIGRLDVMERKRVVGMRPVRSPHDTREMGVGDELVKAGGRQV